ncbi:hypothetical protein M9H77_06862 [Catharanthus roseus]|uniref:Uncharacterized protein n=1 Tax=Catharanthus roseus TaxID=4058 RepID=A0ACC0BTK9_CATRO|nr:hypothetical protein M9H77_06862 [Catharanthus roseus]
MHHYEEFVEENIDFENDVDPNTFEEFLEWEKYVDHRHLFATDRIFNSKVESVNWVKETVMKVNTYLIVTWYLSSRTSDRRPYVTLDCERGDENKPRTMPVVDDEEEVQVKRRGTYGTKKNNMPLLEVVGMAPTGKNFTVATAFMRNKQATTYRWVLQQIKHLYFSNAMSIENQEHICVNETKNLIGDGNCGSRVVADFVFSDEHQCQRFVDECFMNWSMRQTYIFHYWVQRKTCAVRALVGIPDSLYVIANAFNLRVVLIAQLGSTTVLRLHSYSDRPGGTLVIGLLIE